MKLKIYTDWWARWNPWNAWIWVYITDENGNTVEKRYKSLWIKTNNQAEYLGALYGIQRWIELWATEIQLFMDSELVIRQLTWEYKIKNLELKEIRLEISTLLAKWWWKITYTHIPREKNKEADRLSNVAMDQSSF